MSRRRPVNTDNRKTTSSRRTINSDDEAEELDDEVGLQLFFSSVKLNIHLKLYNFLSMITFR